MCLRVDGAGSNSKLILMIVDLGRLTAVSGGIYLTITFP